MALEGSFEGHFMPDGNVFGNISITHLTILLARRLAVAAAGAAFQEALAYR
jgi:hypothetical protein